MQGTPRACKISNVIVGGQQYKQIRIPSYILQTSHAQDIYTQTFINCGANINCINYGFAQRNKIPLKKLEKPLMVKCVHLFNTQCFVSAISVLSPLSHSFHSN